MARSKAPVTAATRELRANNVDFSHHPYDYEEHGGTAVSAQELGVSEHAVIKTLIMEDEEGRPMIVLMHGDLKVSTRELARTIGVKSISTCKPDTANRQTGFVIGGTSPFGTRKKMPVYLERTVLDLDVIYINGGKRGYLVGLAPDDLLRVVEPALVQVGIRDV
jgi:Cys-tRNA(Pro) deacylase